MERFIRTSGQDMTNDDWKTIMPVPILFSIFEVCPMSVLFSTSDILPIWSRFKVKRISLDVLHPHDFTCKLISFTFINNLLHPEVC